MPKHHTRGNFFFSFFKLDMIIHYHHVEAPQRDVFMQTILFYFIPECFSSLSRVCCLSWGVGGVLLWCMWECLFSFQLQFFGSVGVETADLQIYHVNEEGIYKMRNRTLITWDERFSLIARCQVVWVLPCLQSQQLWQRVKGKKGKLLKWIEGSMEPETGMANNPFLVALHNALG